MVLEAVASILQGNAIRLPQGDLLGVRRRQRLSS